MKDVQHMSIDLWNKYNLPKRKRHHSRLVARVAEILAEELIQSGEHINIELLVGGALLHDIDKNIPKRTGELHPQTGVRILEEEGLSDVATLIQHHSVQFICDEDTAPKTWEERLLYLSDKMVRDEVIGVDRRFQLWFEEHMPQEVEKMLREAYPKAKQLELDILRRAHLTREELILLAHSVYTIAD